MGVTCSLLGHAFEEADTERERTEQGSEAVTIVREFEECHRCGERRITSESKEVTSIVEPAAVGVETDAESEPTTDPVSDAPSGPDGDESAVDEGIPERSVETEPEEPPDPAAEDAEILDDDGSAESPVRDPGQWPDEATEEFDPGSLTEEQSDSAAASDAESAADDGTEPEPAATTVLDGEYVCPDCGFAEPMDASSLRDGDACPVCHRGYLDARTLRNR